LGKIHTVHASILKLVPDLAALPGEPEPAPALIDWDRWVGPAPLRPYNKRYVEGQWRGHYAFHGGAGLPEWGVHTIDLCQWAAGTDGTSPVEFQIQGDQIHGRYANGVKLVLRLSGFKGEGDWVAPGTCPVRFEGEEGWVETADFGKIATSKPSLLAGQPTTEMSGTDPIKHVREFIDAIKSRSSTAANAEVTRHGHIACHAAAIGWQLARTVNFDPANGKFINDDEANRMCSSPRRAPYTL
jgi:predicted dehydrogenase